MIFVLIFINMHGIFIRFCVIFYLVQQALTKSPPISNSLRVTQSRNTTIAEPCVKGEKAWKCRDCDIIQYCGGEDSPDFTIQCRAINQNKPYCSVQVNPNPSQLKCVSDITACQSVDHYNCSKNDHDTWKCASDCQTVQYCDGNNWSEYSFTCSSQFPGRSYCNKAAKNIADMCVSDESVCEPDPMPCPAEGIFPSLTNCKAYHLCLAKDSHSIPYFCKHNTVYNHVSRSCRLNSPCYTVTSECGTQSKIMPYRLDNSLYVLCRGYWQPVLKSCTSGLVFDPVSLKCEFKCSEEGGFANLVDSESYYMCFLDGDVLRKQVIHCPKGTKFDEEKKYCSLNAYTEDWICYDCRTLTGNNKFLACEDQFPGRPYCNNTETDFRKKCVSNSVACAESSNFICPGKGVYPSLTNCREYYSCTAKEQNGVKYICEYKTVFNYAKQDCITNSPCYTAYPDCGNQFKMIPYKPNSTLYVICQKDKTPILRDCGNFVFYPNLLKCSYNCKAEGKFGNPTEPEGKQTSFFQCILNEKSEYDVKEIGCVYGLHYDKYLEECVS